MEPLDELLALAVGMGFPEAQARRCLDALADTPEAQSLFLSQPERLVNALLEFGQPPPRARAAAAGGGGAADVIDLCDSDDDAPAQPVKRARADAPPLLRDELPARAEPPPAAPAAAASAGAAGGGGNLLAQLAAERHARRGVPAPAPAETGPPALEEVKLLTCALPRLRRAA